jgi:hypothetical protein
VAAVAGGCIVSGAAVCGEVISWARAFVLGRAAVGVSVPTVVVRVVTGEVYVIAVVVGVAV